MKLEWNLLSRITAMTVSLIIIVLVYYGLYRLIMHIIKSAIRYKIEYEYEFRQKKEKEKELLDQLDKIEQQINDFEKNSKGS